MRRYMYSFLLSMILPLTTLIAVESVWKGTVNSNGKPSETIKLEIGKYYQIKASGTINLGKWWQNKQPLADDACYEFNSSTTPKLQKTLNNTLSIDLCNDGYKEDHVYLSKPFLSVTNGIHFWIYDTDYTDNSGSLSVEVLKVDAPGA